MSMGCNSKEVSQGWWQERGELLFGEEFEERGFVVIEGALKGGHELHDCTLKGDRVGDRLRDREAVIDVILPRSKILSIMRAG